MALDPDQIQQDAAAAVDAAFEEKFGGGTTPKDPDAVRAAVAEVIASLVPVVINAIKNDADLTGVTEGTDTVAGGVD